MLFLSHVLKAFVPLFVAIDAFAVLPVYLTLTEGMSSAQRRRVNIQSLFTALLAGVGFMAIGKAVFALLNITVPDFQVAGGLLLVVLGVVDLIWGREERRRADPTMGVVPIGVPLLVGPAVFTTLLVTIDPAAAGTLGAELAVSPWIRNGATVTAFVLNLVIVWYVLRAAPRIVTILGEGGTKAASKLVALLLAAIGIRIIRLGVVAMIVQNRSVV